MNDKTSTTPDAANSENPELEGLKAQISQLQGQIQATANATRTDRQVLDTVENNLIVVYKGLDARLQGIEGQVKKLLAALEEASKPQE